MKIVYLLTLVLATIGIVHTAPEDDGATDIESALQEVLKQSPDENKLVLLDKALIQVDDGNNDEQALQSIVANVQDSDDDDNALESGLRKSLGNKQGPAKLQWRIRRRRWRPRIRFRRVRRIVRKIRRIRVRKVLKRVARTGTRIIRRAVKRVVRTGKRLVRKVFKKLVNRKKVMYRYSRCKARRFCKRVRVKYTPCLE